MVLGILGVMALLLVIYWSFVRDRGDEGRQPPDRNIFEPNDMREGVNEEVDDTEHLYLEQ